ncbi:helix-turn-helix domain-containing protein [Sediminicola luteus]|nr:helix-turn-helix transcriptional regulator [Sediminicola luteus]
MRKQIPVLHIEQFEAPTALDSFYASNLAIHLERNAHMVHTPHKHDFYLCVLFVTGSGVHEIDFDTYPVKPGSVFFLHPGQTHAWRFDSEVHGYIFFHSKAFFEYHYTQAKLSDFPFYFSVKNPPVLHLDSKQLSILIPLYKDLVAFYGEALPYRKRRLLALMELIYLQLSPWYNQGTEAQMVGSPLYLDSIRRFETLLETHFKLEKSASYYASALGMTPKHLNRIVQAGLAKTTTQMIRERLVLEAKRNMVQTQEPLANIALDLGYADYAYFSKIFKSETGMGPKDFRKQYQ